MLCFITCYVMLCHITCYVYGMLYIENITRWREDMNFMFETKHNMLYNIT